MPQLKAVSASEHRRYSWMPFTHYKFAKGDQFIPLLVNEFKLASTMAPIAFIKKGEGYQPILIAGLESKRNLLVSSEGYWLGGYVPSHYRSHPFCIGKNQDGKELLCFHSDSEFVHDRIIPGESKPFIQGEALSTDLQEIYDFLKSCQTSGRNSESFCSTCKALDLFMPWSPEVKLNGKTKRFSGFYCINEIKLKNLTDADAKSMLATGALGAIYYHLASLPLTTSLETLYYRQAKASETEESGVEYEDVFTGFADDESINFEW